MNKFTVNHRYDEIVCSIEQDGYAIIENVLSKQCLDELRSEFDARILSRSPDVTGNEFMGSRTVRFGRLMYKHPIARTVAMNSLVKNVLDRTLLNFSPKYRLSFTGVMHLLEGQKAQVLHRDNVPFWNPSPIVLVASMFAVSDFIRDNGATVIVPGSHRWSDERIPQKDELKVAEMPAGSVLLYAGNLLHGSGTCKQGSRTGLSLQYAVSWLAGDENQFAANEEELRIARTLDDNLLELMGYDVVARNWGTVDDMHPIDFLKGHEQTRSVAPAGSEFENGRVRELRLVTNDPTSSVDYRYNVTLD